MPLINRGNFNMKNKDLKDKVNATKSLTTIDPFTFYSLDTFDSNELKKFKKRHWLYIVYPESAPSDWMEMLKQSGLQFAVSPLHDQDLDVAGNKKKPHWHIIVSFDGPTTFNTASTYCEVTKGPYPTACGNVRGAYEYFTHKNDPDKYQYNPLDIKEFNGFTMELSSKEFLRIKKELANLILKENISEITEFDLIVRMMYQDDYYEVATNSTYYFNSLIKSLHHNKEAVEKRMKMIKGQVAGTVDKNQEEKDDESCGE